MPETSNGAGSPAESECVRHASRIQANSDAIVRLEGAVLEGFAGLHARLDEQADPADSLREVLTGHDFSATGYGTIVEATRSTAELAITRGAEVATSKTGAILALVLLVGSVAGSGLALRTEWGAIESTADAAEVANLDADTSPPGADD